MRLKGVELGDRDEPEVVMKRQATGKNSKIPNIFQFHHFFQLCVCLFVYISILIEGQKVIVVFIFFSLLSWEMMVCHFNWVCGDVECWGGGGLLSFPFLFVS